MCSRMMCLADQLLTRRIRVAIAVNRSLPALNFAIIAAMPIWLANIVVQIIQKEQYGVIAVVKVYLSHVVNAELP